MSLLLLFFVISIFLPCSDALAYYISADPITSDICNNTSSSPCYSLQQLGNGNGLLVNKTNISLRLLSGTHVLSENSTLLLSNV